MTRQSLVDRILAAKKANPLADTLAEEHEIDRLDDDIITATSSAGHKTYEYTETATTPTMVAEDVAEYGRQK